MKIPAIARRICPAYDRYVERKRLAKVLVNSPIHDELVSKHAARRKAVFEYLNENPKLEIKNFNSTYNPSNLEAKQFGVLLDECGDDLEKIHRLYGNYGLAKYADVRPETLFGRSSYSIVENNYSGEKTVAETFYEYMLLNRVGSLKEVFSRFGQSGAGMYEHCSKMGFVQTGENSYKLNPFGERQIMVSLAEKRIEPALDAIAEMLE